MGVALSYSKARACTLVLASVASLSCSSSSEDALGKQVALSGSVQKGPFVVGSSVSLSLLDGKLAPNGSVFQTQTSNDRGEFDISFPASGPVSLAGQGFYFNEVLGSLSLAPLTLRAFYAPSQAQDQKVFVNMVTHLTAERIKTLVSGGTAFAAAVQQAEGELLRQLHITSDDYQPSIAGVSMDVTGGDTRDNAYLLGVSSVLIQAAVLHQSGSLDAALQETLNSYTLDLADDGTLEQARRDDVAAALAQLQVDAVQANLARRLAELGSGDDVPDMRQTMDQTRCCQQGTTFAACRFADGMPTCDAGLACAAGLGCVGADACCLPAGGLGQPCGEAVDPLCADPNGCPIVNVCDAGLACQPDSEGPPGPGSYVCLPGGALGQACLSGGTCDAGLRCSSAGFRPGASTTIACRYGGCCETPDGAACSPSMPCPAGEACVAGFCEASCDALQCLAGSSCYLTPNDQAMAVAVCSPVGCDEDSDCPAGSLCDGVACQLPGSLPATGGAGQRCSAGNTCAGQLVCKLGPADCNGAPSCCVTANGELDQPCQSGGCNEGLECRVDGPRGPRCLPVTPTGGLGEPCLPGDLCNPGLECQSDGPLSLRCLEVPSQGRLGEPCIDVSAIWTCDIGFVCNFGTACIPYELNECCLPEQTDAGAPDAGP